MRHIHVEDGLRLCFPARDEAFNEGVEIGLLAGQLAFGRSEFTNRIASASLEQARSLAVSMGYRVHVVSADADWTDVTFLLGRKRPRLTLVYSAAVKSG